MAIHRKILRWLETELFEGNIQLGQSLPDDQRIAHAIGVGRSRTRDALKTLEDMELMRLYSGRGKEIIPYLYEEPAPALLIKPPPLTRMPAGLAITTSARRPAISM